MNKNEIVHKLTDLVLEVQSQKKHYASLSFSYESLKVIAQKGSKDFELKNDSFIEERFDLDKIERSEWFNRMLLELESLVEVQDVLQM